MAEWIVEITDGLPHLKNMKPFVRCKDCIHRQMILFGDGENVRLNACELNHNKVQPDDWFCADGERKEQEDG